VGLAIVCLNFYKDNGCPSMFSLIALSTNASRLRYTYVSSSSFTSRNGVLCTGYGNIITHTIRCNTSVHSFLLHQDASTLWCHQNFKISMDGHPLAEALISGAVTAVSNGSWVI
jgi:hypothetical protein